MRQVRYAAAIVLGLGLLAPLAFAEGEFTLKVMAINPSKEQTQRVQIKAPLPKEIRPEDILDKSDLEVAYDSQENAYFVHGEYELKPEEAIEREIVVKDIWTVPMDELASMRSEVTQTTKLLENTDFQERASFLETVIETKLNKILERQQLPVVSPDKHISAYRENLALLDSVKADLMIARSLLTQAKPRAATLVVWKLFIWIVLFLGLMSLSFYLIWHRQLKAMPAPTFGPEPPVEPEAPAGQPRQAKADKPMRPEDIEKFIKEGA